MSKLSSMAGTYGIQGLYQTSSQLNFNVATGGTISQVGKWAVHTFTATGTFSLTKQSTYPGFKTIYYCIIGGGAGGVGYTRGGAGGGVRTGSYTAPSASYSITAVGAGGAASGSGGTSTFNGLSATGGSTTTSGTPGGFTYGASLTTGGATVYGGGGGSTAKGQDCYLWNGVSNWPSCGAGGAGTRWTMPDGTQIGAYSWGGDGGTSSPGQMYPGTWVWSAYIWDGAFGAGSSYGTGGNAGLVASTDPSLGVQAQAAQPGTAGAVIIAYRNRP